MTPTIHEIGRVVAEAFGLTLADLQARSRKRRYVIPRWVAIRLAHELTDKTHGQIAYVFGMNGDWWSVAHALKQPIDMDLAMQIWCRTPQAGLCAIAITEGFLAAEDRDFLALVDRTPARDLITRSRFTHGGVYGKLRRLRELGLIRNIGCQPAVWVRAGWAA